MTILGGAAFVGVQVYEYIKLVSHGVLPSGFREGSEIAELAAADPVKYGLATGKQYISVPATEGFQSTQAVSAPQAAPPTQLVKQ
jgi:hypothetical protein